ncbi:similar to Saccharomyces cerevisiae YPR201W ARR3 Plasma membrane metalloid/H+ antiporter [Maudiozyma barnettii]|uniref:Similar to Saccharomyces cerevisiae YPR201W ARR3 Plasma membrane metalloid/H+ antiporter n=1 Tax=Maudiozyma barnettii TaxID=61262 RepID=A0A8H2ZK19_9SACH|nr:Arr3p [Kazachstania barnettii]CAB4254752.1 similar to Saccharomyces cerevisiae YPR201W ARR3 Plasma membrane metalloid/H+ antiporter [Kazachstania barnettii]CAD1782867.1 similar to Saccharomyces cerevisiae YPR201W ARR3 Plasma membrane metalloid/H+ antiporter [Kazachstania barnettii]
MSSESQSRETTKWSLMFRNLSWTDRILPFTIILSIIIGVLVSEYSKDARKYFDSSTSATFVGVSIPLVIGMIVMMLPPLCRVEWEMLWTYVRKPEIKKPIIYSLILNWLVCPFLMFGLSWLVLFKEPEYREGVIMIGMARCIAMVITWNQIAGGDNTLCVVLVIINSVLQMILYAPYQIFFCYVITGGSYSNVSALYSDVAKSVGVFLGIPIGAGFLIRFISFSIFGKEVFINKILPFINPWGFIGFHFTIIVIFLGNGHNFLQHIGSAFLCFVPLALYFLIAWFGTFFLMRVLTRTRKSFDNIDSEDSNGCNCEKEKLLQDDVYGKNTCDANYAITMTQCFTTASNNFELSLAVAVSLYGNGSKQAIAATFGPLLEVPILLCLAILSRYFEHKFIWSHKPGVSPR